MPSSTDSNSMTDHYHLNQSDLPRNKPFCVPTPDPPHERKQKQSRRLHCHHHVPPTKRKQPGTEEEELHHLKPEDWRAPRNSPTQQSSCSR
ncbi:hypothetical protein V8C44DRAFT_87047 [Trichoderma aethiopicum]